MAHAAADARGSGGFGESTRRAYLGCEACDAVTLSHASRAGSARARLASAVECGGGVGPSEQRYEAAGGVDARVNDVLDADVHLRPSHSRDSAGPPLLGAAGGPTLGRPAACLQRCDDLGDGGDGEEESGAAGREGREGDRTTGMAEHGDGSANETHARATRQARGAVRWR